MKDRKTEKHVSSGTKHKESKSEKSYHKKRESLVRDFKKKDSNR